MSAPESQPLFKLEIPVAPESAPLTVRKRDGRVAPFNEARVSLAIEGAFRDVLELGRDAALPDSVRLDIDCLTQSVVQKAVTAARSGRDLEIELIQDLVETELMFAGKHAVVRGYILLREERRKARLLNGTKDGAPASTEPQIAVTLADGTQQPLDVQEIRR